MFWQKLMTTNFNPYEYRESGDVENIIMSRAHYKLNEDYTVGNNFRAAKTNNYFFDGFFLSLRGIIVTTYDFIFVQSSAEKGFFKNETYGFAYLAVS